MHQKSNVFLWIAVLFFLTAVGFLSYVPLQSDFYEIGIAALVSFLAYYVIVFVSKPTIKIILLVGLLIRFGLIFSFPNLSDDIYRFVWDGLMTTIGNNPYGSLPTDHLGDLTTSHMTFLIENMNSPNYYTIYPPFTQLIFYISNWAGDDIYSSSIIIKVCFLVSEIFTFLGIRKLLNHLGKPDYLVGIYWLNPLIIVEGIGNLHFEIIMASFLIWAIYYLFVKPKIILGAFFLGLSIASKLLPLMFLPYFMFRLKGRKRNTFFTASFVFLAFMFLPIALGLDFANFGSSIDLYFQKFEFNAGIYYVLRYIGKILTGYNQIQYIGPLLGLTTVGLIVYRAYKNKLYSLDSFVEFAFFSFCLYLIFATTVHPWYLSIPVLLSVFVKWRFAVLWSALIFLTYINYSYEPYAENLMIVVLEYMLVIGMVIYEFSLKRQITPSIQSKS